MKVSVRFTNKDTLNLKKNKAITSTILVLGIIFTASALAQIFCILFKPEGGDKILSILGGKYIEQSILAILFLAAYFLIRNSRSV